MTERRQPRSRLSALAALAVGLLVLLTPLNKRWSQPLLDVQLRLLAQFPKSSFANIAWR